MAKQIETVQRGQAITAEAWNALVERINRLERDRFSMTVPPRIPKQKLFPAAPFVLYTDWQKRDDDKIKDLVWWAGAHPIDFKTGEIDYEQDNIVKVYAPLNTDDKKPAGSAPDWKFWAIWKDERWVTLQTEIGKGGVETFSITGGEKKDGDLYFNATHFNVDSEGHTVSLKSVPINKEINIEAAGSGGAIVLTFSLVDAT